MNKVSYNYGEEGRNYWIQEGGTMLRELCEMNLRELSEYLTSVEAYLAEKEKIETEEIEQRFKGDVDWSKEYPWWYQGIIGKQLRESFIVSLMSATEYHLNDICSSLHNVLNLPITATDLHGGFYARTKLYLTKMAKLPSPPTHIWDRVECIYLLRNSLVHAGGTITESKKLKRLKSFQRSSPGLSIDSEYVTIETAFCKYAHHQIVHFFELIHEEYHKLCKELSKNIT